MRCDLMVAKLPVLISGYTISFLTFVLPVVGIDIAIGAAWLETLGLHVADYSAFMT